MEYNEYVQNVVGSYVEHMTRKAIFIKHYNTLDITLEQIIDNVNCSDAHCFMYHDFKICEMKSAFEPFLSWINTLYRTFYEDKYSIEEFIGKCDVYYLHRDTLCEYIRTGICRRGEDILVEEYEFEHKMMLKSIYSIFEYVAMEHNVVMVISKLHMASYSCIEFLNYTFSKENNIHFIITYNDIFFVKDYIKPQWDKLINYADNNNMILEWGKIESKQSVDLEDNFEFVSGDIGKYVEYLNNMYYVISFQDAKYYLDIIYEKFEHENVSVTMNNRMNISALYVLVNLGMNNLNQALYVCENMVPWINDSQDKCHLFTYNYLSAMAHLVLVESELVYKFCSRCRDLAEEMHREDLVFKIDIIECISGFGSFKDLFKCNFSYKVSQNMIDNAIRFKYNNLLAYLYIFGFDNDKKSIDDIANGRKVPVYFNKGIKIAQDIGNTNLLLTAYMKNIIMYSEYGYHRYVRLMYEKRIGISDKYNQVRRAHMYSGMGYNSIVLEEYSEADRYFRNSILILAQNEKAEDVAEVLYNMSLNYYVAGINEEAIVCMENVIKVLKLIGIQNIRICNTSKLFGIIAMANFKIGQYYNSYYYLDKMESILSHIINSNDERRYKMWEEDLFLYHLTKAVLLAYEENMEEAEKEFNQAQHFMEILPGAKFYLYAELALMRGKAYKECGRISDAEKVISDAIDFCMKAGYQYKVDQLKALLFDTTIHLDDRYAKRVIPFDDILHMAAVVGTHNKLKDRERDVNFLSVCQDILIREYDKVDEVIDGCMNAIQNSFNLDQIILLDREQCEPSIIYSYAVTSINKRDVDDIFEFCELYKKEFIANRIDKSFNKYMPIIQKFGANDVVTVVVVPVVRDDRVVKLFLGVVNIHRNFTGNKVFLNNANLTMMRFAIEQLDEAIRRISNVCMIRSMNIELEKAAITDKLTGLYNRFGFGQIIDEKAKKQGIVLYMDIDNFKYYNDSFGHHVGDKILTKFADILLKITQTKGYAVRYGGDEFVIIVPEADISYGKDIAKKILYNMNTKLKENIHGELKKGLVIDSEKEITCSIGLSEYINDGELFMEEALKRADIALYNIKNNSKGNYQVFTDETLRGNKGWQ